MKTTHRYVRSGYGSKNADFDIVSEHSGRVASTAYEKMARRIVACLNYCEGVNTAELETAPKSVNLRAILDALDSAANTEEIVAILAKVAP